MEISKAVASLLAFFLAGLTREITPEAPYLLSAVVVILAVVQILVSKSFDHDEVTVVKEIKP